jgi:aminopeptidase N
MPMTNFDIQSYKIQIAVHHNNDSIHASATITYKKLKLSKAQLPQILSLNFKNKNKYGKGMQIISVTNSKGHPLKYSHTNGILAIRLTDNTQIGTVNIQYKGIPENGLIIGNNKFGAKTWFGDNWPQRAHYWFPCVDHPLDKAMFTWEVRAPKEYSIVANGIRNVISADTNGDRIEEFVQTEPIPTKVAVIGIAKMQSKLLKYKDSIEVTNFYYPETFSAQPDKMDIAIEILDFFEKKIGPYPYKKLYNVQSTTMFGGMENANNIFYDENEIDDQGNTERIHELIAHEIAHQWFGNSISEKNFSHLWLCEGFATFYANYFLEQKYGVEYVKKIINADKARVLFYLKENKRPVVDTTSDYMSLLNANSYKKGGLFLYTLRAEVGEPTFDKIIQTYYSKYKFSNANTTDFKAVAEEVSGKNLTELFNKWLYSTMLPK